MNEQYLKRKQELVAPKPPARKQRKQVIPAYLSEEEIARLFHVIKDPRDRAIFCTCYHRGLRASEIGMIQVGDYHADTGRLTVRRLKGSRGGEYPLTHAEKVAIGVWLRKRGDQPGPLFLSRNHRGISRKRLHALMRQYCAAAKIDSTKAHMHALKHSCGTHLSSVDPDIVAIQDHLGHAQISNTMRYIQIASKRRADFSDRLERIGWGKVRR